MDRLVFFVFVYYNIGCCCGLSWKEYDWSCFGDQKITDADFKKIEDRVLEISRGKHEFKMRPVSKADALEMYKDNVYKTELISNLEDGTITFCDHATFTDLCRGGHIPNTGIIKAMKVMSVAGAYWRGDEKNKQLTRVYGTSFPKQKDLTEYLELLEEAKRRDHRKLGKELELFAFSQKVGQGLPLWLPKGAALRDRLEQFLKRAQKKAGYEQVVTPHIGQKELYVTSGHYAKYGADSFQPIHTPAEGEEFLPMTTDRNCSVFLLFLTNNQHKWSFLHLSISNFLTDSLVSDHKKQPHHILQPYSVLCRLQH